MNCRPGWVESAFAPEGSGRRCPVRRRCGCGHLLVDDGLADRGEGDAGQLQVLDGERNADDRQGEADRRHDELQARFVPVAVDGGKWAKVAALPTAQPKTWNAG